MEGNDHEQHLGITAQAAVHGIFRFLPTGCLSDAECPLEWSMEC